MAKFVSATPTGLGFSSAAMSAGETELWLGSNAGRLCRWSLLARSALSECLSNRIRLTSWAFSGDALGCTDENFMKAQRLFRNWRSLSMYRKEPSCSHDSLTFFLDLSSFLAFARALSSKALSPSLLISRARDLSLAHTHPKKKRVLFLARANSQRLSALWH